MDATNQSTTAITQMELLLRKSLGNAAPNLQAWSRYIGTFVADQWFADTRCERAVSVAEYSAVGGDGVSGAGAYKGVNRRRQ